MVNIGEKRLSLGQVGLHHVVQCTGEMRLQSFAPDADV